MRGRAWLINVGVVSVSVGLAILLCEWGARLLLNPADYLSLEIVHDKILGGVPSPSARSSGFDEWGFRNREVPRQADVVAIGDSHTYGNTAKMDESWPLVAGRLAGLKVYNMGLGGYGPNQYYHLIKTRALSLKPKVIVCGLYMGDDFENAFLVTYGLDYWSYLRKLHADDVNYDIWEPPNEQGFAKALRVWLSRHSVLYKLVFHGTAAATVKAEVQIKNAAKLYDSATTLVVAEKNILEAFLPKGIFKRLNQDSASVREGMRITYHLLEEMNKESQRQNTQFVVVVIPTKEMVFAEYLERDSGMPLHDLMMELIANERVARARTFEFLDEAHIAYLDTLPVLKGSAEKQLYARTAVDMHPGKNGYRVIAEAVADELRRRVGTQ